VVVAEGELHHPDAVLAVPLGARGGEAAGDAAPEQVLLPVEGDRLVDQLLNLPGHVAEVGWGAQDQAVSLCELVDVAVLHPLELDLDALLPRTVPYPLGHPLGVPRLRVVDYEKTLQSHISTSH